MRKIVPILLAVFLLSSCASTTKLMQRGNYDRVIYKTTKKLIRKPKAKDAEAMDPQMRIFHECTWEALEYAGYNPYQYDGLIGIYAGSAFNIEWMRRLLNVGDQFLFQRETLSFNFREYLSPRISYRFDLRGPSLSVNTACSTSLVAVHLACQGLLNGECNIALAGAVAVGLPKKNGYLYQEGMILSPDGHCRAFDTDAQGTVFSNGAGVVVLKTLEDAIEDGDTVHAVIKGTAINNDGTQKIGFTAPSVNGQTDVIKAAHYMAEVEPSSLSFVEAHGTGTPVGDSIEIESLTRAFGTNEKEFCCIGSVKTNIGHLETAAGIAGLIKTVLSLKHKIIPATLNFQTPNPEIDFDDSPFYVNTQSKYWETDRLPRRGGVNSFGIGGSNAFVILEEWCPQNMQEHMHSAQTETGKDYLLPISARTQSALHAIARNLASYLEENPGISFPDVAYTLQVGRNAFEYRVLLVCTGIHDAIQRLSDPDSLEVIQVTLNYTNKRPRPTAAAVGETTPLTSYNHSHEDRLQAITQLWLKGDHVDWQDLHQGEKRCRIPLPTYPFEGKYYWRLMSRQPMEQDASFDSHPPPLRPRPKLELPYEAPAHDTEKALADIWQNIFGIQHIGVNDDFLLLGGDSLKAMRMISRIRKELAIEIKVRDFFHNPTIRGIVESTRQMSHDDEADSHPQPLGEKEYYRMSHVQKRLFTLYLAYPDTVSYNENMAVTIQGELEIEHVQQLIRQLIQRHETLRTSFHMVDGEPLQKVHEEVNFDMEYVDLTPSAPSIHPHLIIEKINNFILSSFQ